MTKKVTGFASPLFYVDEQIYSRPIFTFVTINAYFYAKKLQLLIFVTIKMKKARFKIGLCLAHYFCTQKLKSTHVRTYDFSHEAQSALHRLYVLSLRISVLYGLFGCPNP